ncbi:MAG: M1 family metallopeptidase [bacterium]|nr:M1 family metallopeptidase [bacterium]
MTEVRVVHQVVDLREAYDVQAYDLALEVDGQGPNWSGRVTVELQVGEKAIPNLYLDAGSGLTIQGCSWSTGSDSATIPRKFKHEDGLLAVRFPATLQAGASGTLHVRFTGKSLHSDRRRTAVHWVGSKIGPGRIDCSLQYAGAHNVFPCKSSFYHPEDVPNRSALALTVPKDWVPVGPGSKVSETPASQGYATHRFELNHPTPTWALGFAAGPYKVRRFPWKGDHDEVQVELYRLAEHQESFDELAHIIPGLLEHHERIFGAYPFPDHRLAIVETLAGSSANATWIGVGSGALVPSKKAGKSKHRGRRAVRILSHELGHAWWGHGLHVGSWRDNWMHESFASYGALLYLGQESGKEAEVDAYRRIAGEVSYKHRLAVCESGSQCSATSINNALWFKGPWVLRTLRSQVDNDEHWFGALADFQRQYRFQAISTDDFARVLGEHTGTPWDQFFGEWFEGSGLPSIVGTVRMDGNKLLVDLENRKDRITTLPPSKTPRNFHLNLKLRWKEGTQAHERKLRLKPGLNTLAIDCSREPTNVELVGLESILGPHEVEIIPLPHSGLTNR